MRVDKGTGALLFGSKTAKSKHMITSPYSIMPKFPL